ncbi:MAG: bifunctional phosphopantothenoylcysteine decarboxylase/phosphopantothenate synthase [Pseudomonadota bacterium]|nr:bifunctional phosphopantothenoylcysteine decarboxylase/phosphopantothenate synthase [Pseudomonadota bacterium]
MNDRIPDKLLLGVTGGVAAYKAAEFVRLAIKAGIRVRVVMTAAATRFIGPETFQALTGEAVYTDAWDERIANRMPHIELTRWADAMLVAPATADFMARAASGMADDLLATCAVSRNCPLLLAPAMNVEMWQHPATQRNLRTLRDDGVAILGPAAGEQACGESGFGRLLEPADLLAALLAELAGAAGPGARPDVSSDAAHAQSTVSAAVVRGVPAGAGALPPMPQLLQGRRVLITAGPTFEPIDPVRGITNGSSGKMGFAIAAACRAAGARVTLIAGPVALATPAGCDRIAVQTAAQMHDAVMAHAGQADLFFAVAAVADYTPVSPAERKIKKSEDDLTLQLKPTRDILADVAALAQPPFCIGFAAETHDLERYAREKRARKRIPVIAANLAQSAIGADQNTLWVSDDEGSITLGPLPKGELARQLVAHIAGLYLGHADGHSAP